MQWMIEADKLDVEQRHFIFEEVKSKKNIWIKGFAGSGKSVLLAHAIAEKRRENPRASICVVVFTHSLIAMFKQGLEDLGIMNVEIMTYYKFYDSGRKYDYIYCDEVQDLTPRILQNMTSRGEQLIVAGDSNQSIFDSDPRFRESTVCPTKIEGETNSKAYELNTIYRLTKSVVGAVSALLPEMNILNEKVDRTKEDVNIRLCKGKNRLEEIEHVLSKSTEALNIGESVAIILPSHNEIETFINLLLKKKGKNPWEVEYNCWGRPDYNLFNRYLERCGIGAEYLGNGYGRLRSDKILFMTYHSAKGLDFDNVFLPFLSTGLNISNKTILMVGMTRSKKDLWITYSGNKHNFIEGIKDKCERMTINKNNKEDEFEFDF